MASQAVAEPGTVKYATRRNLSVQARLGKDISSIRMQETHRIDIVSSRVGAPIFDAFQRSPRTVIGLAGAVTAGDCASDVSAAPIAGAMYDDLTRSGISKAA
jgi:hypothetical protein